MSAFLCSADHLSSLVNALRYEDTYCRLDDVVSPGKGTPAERGFSMLLEENIKSLRARYGDDDDWTEDARCMHYNPKARANSILEVIKLAHSYEYQSCEHAEWKESQACRFIRRLISEMTSILPGYDNARWTM
jgi:hypothetical protein